MPTLNLNDKEIHLWLINIHEHTFDNYLSKRELERASLFRFNTDKKRFVVSHNALRKILAQYIGIEPDEISYTFNKYGKPFLKNFKLSFNLSHSKDMVAIAISQIELLGVDIEDCNRVVEYKQLASRFFCESEAKKLVAQPKDEHSQIFYNCWTRKEAFIKAIGEGLSYPLKNFEVTLLTDESVAFIHILHSKAAAKQWSLHSFKELDYTISIAANEPRTSLHHKNVQDLK